MSTVLLTDAQQRKTLAVARSLGKKGINISAGENTKWALALFSKYVKKGYVYPDPAVDKASFYQWLIKCLQNKTYDVFFPMDDHTMEIAVKHSAEILKHTKALLPSLESYQVLSDKASSAKAAKEAGLDCPMTYVPEGLDDLTKIMDALRFPVLLKPRKSSGSRGLKVVEEKANFREVYLSLHNEYALPLIQEFLPHGEKYDVCLLFDKNSQVKASFIQKEVRFFPLEKGPSTVQESVLYPELLEKSIVFLQKLKWQGSAEVEFMVDPRDGKPKFMEVNTRFWASLQMAIFAGVDFPWLYYRLAMGEDFEPITSYEVGKKCRWLLPGDILHFIVNPKRFSIEPSFFATSKQDLPDDTLSWDDPKPLLGFILACLHYLPDMRMWKFMFRR